MSDAGNGISFSLPEGVTSTVTVNGFAAGSTDANGIYSTTLGVTNPNATLNNELKYDRKIYEGVNDTITFKINGVQYDLDLGDTADGYGKPGEAGAFTNEDIRKDLVYKLHNAIAANTELSSKMDARLSMDGTRIQLVSKTNETVTVGGNSLKTLGFTGSFDVNQSVSDKMSNLFAGLSYDSTGVVPASSGIVDFVVNNGTESVRFRYDFTRDTDDTTQDPPVVGAKNKTIKNIMDDIYAKANVKLSYSQLTRKFTLESGNTGSAQNISISLQSDTDTQTDKFLTTLFGGGDFTGAGVTDQGQDAVITITNPGYSSNPADPNYGSVTLHKSTNNFTIDGISYTLNKAEPGVEKTMTLTSNAQGTYDKIKEFVDKYNEMIDKINSKINEKKQYTYLPLTDDQKKEMSEDEIKKWEEKAKEGLLSRDNTLESMLTSMRSAFYDVVRPTYNDPGSIGISLSEIGLSTSNDYSQRGKIIIDEKKLKNAIENNGDKVASLFTKTSETVPAYNPDMSSTERSQRYKEEGIFQRINDIFQDNLRTTRDDGGYKGKLLEMAGIKGDYSELHNSLTDQLDEKDKAISDLIDKLAEKEEKYYLQFSQLEQAMQKLNSQSSWLAQQLGSSGGN
jgi:flagellar hook-associated protein 2